jgi:tetratricopeptide (TPR) repeat protein
VEYVGLVASMVVMVTTLVGAVFGFVGYRSLKELLSSQKELERLRHDYLGEIRSTREGVRVTINSLEEKLDKNLEEMLERLSREAEMVAERQMHLLTEFREKAENATRALFLSDLGDQQFRAGNFEAALGIFREAYTLYPDNYTVNYLLSELYIRQRELDKAVKHLLLVLGEDEDFAPALAALGYVKRLQAERTEDETLRRFLFSQAEENLRRALHLDPLVRDAAGESAYGTLGGLCRRQGRVAEAIRCYTKAEAVTPLNSYPLFNLGLLYADQGEAQRSERCFSRAAVAANRKLAANPFDNWSHFDLAISHLFLGEIEKGLEGLEAALKLSNIGPIETVLDTLTAFKDIPNPPNGLDEAIQLVRGALSHELT